MAQAMQSIDIALLPMTGMRDIGRRAATIARSDPTIHRERDVDPMSARTATDPRVPPRAKEGVMRPGRFELMWQGMVAGLAGYACVAAVIAVADVVAGHSPFYTAALLGGALFYGARDLPSVLIGPGPVLAFNGLHLVVFLALGMIAAWFADFSERGPHFWYVGLVAMMLIAFHLAAVVFMLPAPLRDEMLVWQTLVAGAVAAMAMTAYLVAVHPRLRAELRDFAAQDPDLADSNR